MAPQVRPTPDQVQKRNIVNVNAETVTNVTSTDFPGHFHGEDHAWSLEHFRQNFTVQFHKNEPLDAVFSLIGIDASIANAFRRILISGLPNLAIEDVFIIQNTSIIQDEVLAHRLGLVPLKGSKRGLRWMKVRQKPSEENPMGDTIADFNTIAFELKVDCTWQDKGRDRYKDGETDPAILYNDAHIYASHLKFTPKGQQVNYFDVEPITPVHPKILLAKLRPQQSLDIVVHARFGYGSDHAKFSPVATASYRLLPVINILQPILGDDARKFARCFPKGVIGLDRVTEQDAQSKNKNGQPTGYEGKKGETKAVVKDTFKDTVSRECLRHDEFKDKVKLGRQRDHFIFSVESIGQFDSDELFVDSVKLLKQKCIDMKQCLTELRAY